MAVRTLAGDQLDIFDVFEAIAVDEQQRAEALYGVPKLFASTTRGPAARRAEFDQWSERWGHFNSYHDSHAWLPATCHSSDPTPTCQATVLCVSLGCICDHRRACECVTAHLYRGACTGCDWESDVFHEGADGGVLDALDHAHPGWREDPVVEVRRPEKRAQVEKWRAGIEAQIGPRPEGWPIITPRGGSGTRSVPGRSPWGGYDVADCNARGER